MKEIDVIRKHHKIQRNLRKLSQLNPWMTGFAISMDWMMVAIAIATAEYTSSSLIYLAALFIVAARQHALLTLMHEGSHNRIAQNATLNDFISDVFAAFPLMMDTAKYRKNHLQHHHFLNSEQDPDWARKIHQPIWQFPRKKSLILKDSIQFVFVGAYEWGKLIRHFSSAKPLRIIFFATVLTTLVATGTFVLFLKYWLVSSFLILPSIQRIRSVSEHFGLPRTHELNSSRNVFAPSIERFFLSPHGVNYHLDHHLFPSIPFYHLKQLNGLLMEIPEYREHAHINSSYLWPDQRSVLRDLVDVPATPPPAEAA